MQVGMFPQHVHVYSCMSAGEQHQEGDSSAAAGEQADHPSLLPHHGVPGE